MDGVLFKIYKYNKMFEKSGIQCLYLANITKISTKVGMNGNIYIKSVEISQGL